MGFADFADFAERVWFLVSNFAIICSTPKMK